jgi:ribosome-associated protein
VRKQKCKIHHVEGYSEAHWVLIDLNNVVVHVFDNATREYYELERLWGDAGVVTV